MAKPLALTSGEPAGIGPDIAIEAWLRRSEAGLPPFYLLGDRSFFADRARHLGLKADFAEVSADEAGTAFARALPVVATGKTATAAPGRPDGSSAEAVLASIRQAVGDVAAGRASAVVTNPIAKSVLYRAGFKHPGHTEFLAALTGAPLPVMMLASPGLRVVPITVHASLRRMLEMITAERIVAVTRVTIEALQRHWGIARPRVAIAGLNPHAGEDGTMGEEEITIIATAIEQLRAAGHDVTGPLAADSMFTPEMRARYDVAMGMYHDQALIPLKTLDMHHGVNTTLGLPIIRTSPDHGTAFNIAGTGQADPTSLIAAIDLAAELSRK